LKVENTKTGRPSVKNVCARLVGGGKTKGSQKTNRMMRHGLGGRSSREKRRSAAFGFVNTIGQRRGRTIQKRNADNFGKQSRSLITFKTNKRQRGKGLHKKR